jgi:hypothetical protein
LRLSALRLESRTRRRCPAVLGYRSRKLIGDQVQAKRIERTFAARLWIERRLAR